MPNDRLLHALGLCAKAGRLITGTPMICEAMRTGRPRVYLVLAASDNAENTAKRLRDRTSFYGVPLTLTAFDGGTLSDAVGKSGRISAVAVTDENLSRLVEGATRASQEPKLQ